MNVILAFSLLLSLCLGTPVFAQSPCADCLKAAQDQLKQCLENAISAEDKKSCSERQEDKAKACEISECAIERGKSQNKNEVLPQKK